MLAPGLDTSRQAGASSHFLLCEARFTSRRERFSRLESWV